MAYEPRVRRYTYWYAKLLRLYSRPYYERFGEGMRQTFGDMLRERLERNGKAFGFVLWMYVETSVGIINHNTISMFKSRTLVFVLGALCLLFVPFVAMQFSVDGWDWSGADFLIMAVLLAGIGTALAAATNSNYPVSRRAIGVAVGLLIVALYVHLAVGIVDTWPLAGS